jgi:hypothetical protein
MNKYEKKSLDDKLSSDFMRVSMVSSYLMLNEKKSFHQVLNLQVEKQVACTFFIAPIDVDKKEYTKDQIQSMIDYFAECEEYERCGKLLKIKKELNN